MSYRDRTKCPLVRGWKDDEDDEEQEQQSIDVGPGQKKKVRDDTFLKYVTRKSHRLRRCQIFRLIKGMFIPAMINTTYIVVYHKDRQTYSVKR